MRRLAILSIHSATDSSARDARRALRRLDRELLNFVLISEVHHVAKDNDARAGELLRRRGIGNDVEGGNQHALGRQRRVLDDGDGHFLRCTAALQIRRNLRQVGDSHVDYQR